MLGGCIVGEANLRPMGWECLKGVVAQCNGSTMHSDGKGGGGGFLMGDRVQYQCTGVCVCVSGGGGLGIVCVWGFDRR